MKNQRFFTRQICAYAQIRRICQEWRIFMAVSFSESKTKENLMRAFAGESQARNRYTIAAEKARHAKMYTIANIFEYTADQERAHARDIMSC